MTKDVQHDPEWTGDPEEVLRFLVYPVGKAPYPVEVKRREIVDRLHDILGGYFDSVRVTHDGTLRLFVHDEGLLIGLPPNMVTPGGVLVGVVVLSRNDLAGISVTLTDEDIKQWERAFPRFSYAFPPPSAMN